MRKLAFSMVLLGVLGASAAQASAHTISPTSHNFGNVKVGQSSPVAHFTITAEGTPFDLTGSSVSSPDFTLVTDPNKPICGSFVTPGSSCVVSAIFRPVPVPGGSYGLKTATLTINYVGGTFIVPLSGNAVNPNKKQKCKKKRGGHGRRAAAAKKCKKK